MMNRYDKLDQARYHLDRCGQGAETGQDHHYLADYLGELGAPEQLIATARRFGQDEVVFALYAWDKTSRTSGYGPGRQQVADWLAAERQKERRPSIADMLPTPNRYDQADARRITAELRKLRDEERGA